MLVLLRDSFVYSSTGPYEVESVKYISVKFEN